MKNIQTVLELIEKLKPFLEPNHSINIDVRNYTAHEISAHGFAKYSDAVEFLQMLGVGERTKSVYPEGRTVLVGMSEGVTCRVFVDDLPPTCKLERWTEKIPKSQTVETGEFIEVERTKVVCGEGA